MKTIKTVLQFRKAKKISFKFSFSKIFRKKILYWTTMFNPQIQIGYAWFFIAIEAEL